MRRAHAADELPSQTRRACSQCRNLKTRCEGGKPCRECIRRRTLCSIDGPVRPSRRESLRRSPRVAESLPAASPLPERRDEHFVDLYFQRFHPHWPFIHRGSFNLRHETPLLAQSMMAIGLWASGEQRSQRAALDLHRTLDSAIHQQRVSGRCTIISLDFSKRLTSLRRYGMPPMQRTPAAPVPGRSRRTRPFCCT